MDWNDAWQVALRVPEQRFLFPYHKDRYAPMLLDWIVGGRRCPRERIERSPFAPLLRKALVRDALAGGDGRCVEPGRMAGAWRPRPLVFDLGLGLWGRLNGYWRQGLVQTSRPGLNLIVTLDFTSGHDRALRSLLGTRTPPFAHPGHPGRPGRNTLAWARLDVAPRRGEVLVEEVQSDWIPNARRMLELLTAPDLPVRLRKACLGHWLGPEARLEALERYVRDVLPPYARIWDEAMLAAALWISVDVLGMRRIWMHTWAGGQLMKRMDPPPRSVYETLPRRFCFQKTREAPRLLQGSPHRRVRKALRQRPVWHRLHLRRLRGPDPFRPAG